MKDYVFTKMLQLDTEKIRKSSLDMSEIIMTHFHPDQYKTPTFIPATTTLFRYYNIFCYPFPEFPKLLKEITLFFKDLHPEHYKSTYYIESWINVYHKGEYIDWHGHWDSSFKSWHGFYCVDVEPNSGTYYRLSNDHEEYFVPSKNNLLVLSKSDRDQHKTTPWEDEKRPRITIAFNILPIESIILDLEDKQQLNHWVPLIL